MRAVIAVNYERIHRSNLVAMGVLPLQFLPGTNAPSLGLDGSEVFDFSGIDETLQPRSEIQMTIRHANGRVHGVPLRVRIDTPTEIEYYRHGGILPFVLRQLLAS